TDEWFRGVENTPQSIEGSELVSEYAIDDVWSAFTFTAEESDMLASVGTDLGKYLDESRSAFITGQLPLSEWDTFVTTLEDIGLSDFMEAQQAAFGRRQETCIEDARERVTHSSPTRSGKDYSHASDHPSNRPGLRCRGGRRRCPRLLFGRRPRRQR